MRTCREYVCVRANFVTDGAQKILYSEEMFVSTTVPNYVRIELTPVHLVEFLAAPVFLK